MNTKTNVFVEIEDIQTGVNNITRAIKTVWSNKKKRVNDIDFIDVYIKAEDKKAYFVLHMLKSLKIENITGYVEINNADDLTPYVVFDN